MDRKWPLLLDIINAGKDQATSGPNKKNIQ